MKVLLFCAIFCVSLRVSTLQPIDKREIDDDQSVKASVVDQPDNAKTANVKRSVTYVTHSTHSMPILNCPPGYTLHGNHCHSSNIVPAIPYTNIQNGPCTDGCNTGYVPVPYGGMTIWSSGSSSTSHSGPIIMPY